MSKTIKGNKPIGYEYWGKRPGTKGRGSSPPGKEAKKRTHRLERLESKKIIRDAKNGTM